MYLDGGVSLDLNTVGAQAAEMEDMGYAGVMTAETAMIRFFRYWSQHKTPSVLSL